MQELLPGAAASPARRRSADDLSGLRVSAPGRSTLLRLFAAVAAGLLAALSRPPVDIGWLACVALVPLFVVWRDRSPRASAGYAFLAGAVYYSITCSWVWYFGAVAIVPFVGACAGYWAGAGALVGWLRSRGITNPFLTAAVWVLADAAVARFPLQGFSWGELGYAFHDMAPLRAVASVGGVSLVTFLAVAFNAFVADCVARRRVRSYVWAYAGVAVIVLAVVGSTVTRAEPRVTKTMRVALVQGNGINRDLTQAEEDARYLPRSHFALANRITDPVDLIVFPESSMDADPRTDPFIRNNLARIARQHRAWVVANATADADPAGKRADNIDVLFDPSGRIVDTYSKRHLVPFGEYVPLRNFLQPLIPALDQVPRDYKPGNRSTLFDIAGVPVAPVICFESAFGYQVRPRVQQGAQMLLVSTNNRSYRRSANSPQHLAIGQMRAAETGRPLVQAAISGISAVVDANGVVQQQTRLFDRTVLETTVAVTTGQTPYVRYGEWVILGSLVLVVVVVVIALLRRRRNPSLDLTAHENVSVNSRIAGYAGIDVSENGNAPEPQPAGAPDTPAPAPSEQLSE